MPINEMKIQITLNHNELEIEPVASRLRGHFHCSMEVYNVIKMNSIKNMFYIEGDKVIKYCAFMSLSIIIISIIKIRTESLPLCKNATLLNSNIQILYLFPFYSIYFYISIYHHISNHPVEK